MPRNEGAQENKPLYRQAYVRRKEERRAESELQFNYRKITTDHTRDFI
jgi:hypothetical protein